MVVSEMPQNAMKEAAFERFWTPVEPRQAAAELAYDLTYPKHEFLQYVVEHRLAVLHGSNDASIDVLTPVRRTIDARVSHSGAAVFACADGVWPLHYALLDRVAYHGTLRNDARLISDAAGARRRAYYFSVNQTARWRDGTIYFLPIATFSRLGDETSLEWASEAAVRPIARLSVSPGDFPYPDHIRTHDDGPLARARELSIRLVTTHTGYEELEDGYVLTYAASETWAAEARELITILGLANSWLKGEVEFSEGGSEMKLRLWGSTALKQMLGQGLSAPRPVTRPDA
jgi:hypothetical protein